MSESNGCGGPPCGGPCGPMGGCGNKSMHGGGGGCGSAGDVGGSEGTGSGEAGEVFRFHSDRAEGDAFDVRVSNAALCDVLTLIREMQIDAMQERAQVRREREHERKEYMGMLLPVLPPLVEALVNIGKPVDPPKYNGPEPRRYVATEPKPARRRSRAPKSKKA